MRFYEIKRVINAPPGQIWSVLKDPKRLSDGSFSIIKIEGQIVQGGKIKLWSTVDPKRAFLLNVSKLDPPTEMVWESGMPLGLFTGRRSFALRSVPGGTEFHMREEYTGPMAGLMFRMIPDLMPSFKTFANGLASACEDAT